MLNARTQSILEAAIKEHIKTGEPVSSKELSKKYDFGVKDATIRNELSQLTKDGFLMQAHTSGGRVPTDKGYNLFVENTFQNVLASKKIIGNRQACLTGRQARLVGGLKKGNIRDFADAISGGTKSLGVVQSGGRVYKTGLNELFERLDTEARQDLNEIIRDFESLDQRLESFKKKFLQTFSSPQVYIGKKSPITQSGNLSVILDSYTVDGEKVIIAVIGPKRMDYDKNLKLLKGLHEMYE